MREFTGKHMLMVMGGAFAVIISVNLVMAVFAIGSFPGTIVKNSYVASQDYNKHLQAAKDRAALEWRTEIALDAEGLKLSVFDRSGRTVDDLVVHGRIGRPASALEDRDVELPALGSGIYAVPLTLERGRWEVRLHGRNRVDELVVAISQDIWVDR